MSDELQLWAIGIGVAIAVIPWAFSIHAKVAVIAHSVESLPEIVEELRACIEEHEQRLEKHDQEIQTLKAQARAG